MAGRAMMWGRARRAAALAFAIGAGLLGAWSAPAAACSGQIIASESPSLDYNPFDAAGQSQKGRVTVKNIGAEPCALRLELVRLDGGGASGAPAIELRTETGALLVASAPSLPASGQLTSPSLPPDATYDFAYLVKIPAGQMLAPGSYTQRIELRLQDAAGAELPQTGTMTVICRVADHLGVNIAGGGTLMTIDFGALTQGAERSVQIQTRSNRKFTLKLTSEAAGALAMAPPYEKWRIPYRTEIDRHEVALPAEIGPFAATVLSGNSVEARFTIGDIGGKRAGLYTDVITIEIVAAM
jgi:hypothetical protein